MGQVNTVNARAQFSEIINRAAFGKERVTLTRRGKEIVAVVRSSKTALSGSIVTETRPVIIYCSANRRHDMAHKCLVTLIEGEDGYIIAECPALPGCVSQGKTREEALKNIHDH